MYIQELKINHHLTERRALLNQSAIPQVPMNLLYQKALSIDLWNAGVDELREYWSGIAEVFTSLRNGASRVVQNCKHCQMQCAQLIYEP